MRHATATLLALLLSVLAQREAACAPLTIDVYTSRAEWVNAVGGQFETEDFNSFTQHQLPPGLNHLGKVDFFNERYSGNMIVEPTLVSTVNGTTCLRIEASQQNGSTPPFSPDLIFPQPVYGFGGDWYYGVNGTLTVGGQTFKFADYLLLPTRKGFLGFVSNEPLTSAEFYTVTPFNMLVSLDDLSFSVVPEPSTLALLGMGALALLGYAGRRRRR